MKNLDLSGRFPDLRFGSLSLVKKLMFLYSLTTIGLFAAICLFLYPAFARLAEKINGTSASSLTIECFEKVIVSLLIGSFGAIIFGYMIARKGLSRLRELEDKMDSITAESLDDRILPDEWPSELRNLAFRFNEMLNRIQASFQQLSQFSSDIAHELRTPIHNLKNMAEAALLKNQSAEDYRRVLESSMDEYQNLSKLVENMLFIARSDHKQIALQRERIAVQKEIAHVFEYYQAIADERQIQLSCIGSAELSVDLILFKRVLVNILSNALRHSLDYGKIVVHIESMMNFVKIAIEDSGSGIPPEHLDKLFNRFYRTDASRTLHSGGNGLGLAIVKSIIDLHQGSISIESQINIGTRVILKLPLRGFH